MKLIFGGDVNFSGISEYLVKGGKCTYNQSLAHIKRDLADADFVLVNLETVFKVNDGEWLEPRAHKPIHLIADSSTVTALK